MEKYNNVYVIAFLAISVGAFILKFGGHISNDLLGFVITYSSIGLTAISFTRDDGVGKFLQWEMRTILGIIVVFLWAADKYGFKSTDEFNTALNFIAMILMVVSALGVLYPCKNEE